VKTKIGVLEERRASEAGDPSYPLIFMAVHGVRRKWSFGGTGYACQGLFTHFLPPVPYKSQ